jgi:hypothetical protein
MAGLRRDAVRSQVIDVLEAQEIKEAGNEEGKHRRGATDQEFFRTEAHDRPGFGRSIELGQPDHVVLGLSWMSTP